MRTNVIAFEPRAEPVETADDELVTRTLAGDDDAFEQLVARHQRRIYRVAWAITRDEAEADAVTQDTFVQAYTALSRFERRSGFETWLTRIAINRGRDALRRRKFASLFTSTSTPEDEGHAPVLLDERPGPERELLSRQLRGAITRAEQTLSSQQQIIFRLRHHEERSLEEIAEHLGLKPGTVRAHLFRAIHKIRSELAAFRPGYAQRNES